MEVLGTALSVIALGIQAADGLYKYYDAFSSHEADSVRTVKKLDQLVHYLRDASDKLDKCQAESTNPKSLPHFESAVDECQEIARNLKFEFDKIRPLERQGTTATIRTLYRRTTYPFRKRTLQRLEEDVDDFIDCIRRTLQLLLFEEVTDTRLSTQDIGDQVKLIRADQISTQLREWLRAPDASINLNEATKNKHENAGSWLVRCDTFTKWLHEPQSFLWLVGFAGCGKSVLVSTAIEHLLKYRANHQNVGVGYFYFTFSDEKKQDVSAMIRALILQLSGQLRPDSKFDAQLKDLRDKHHDTEPTVSSWMSCLHSLVGEFNDVYILLDALDESPRDRHRSGLLDNLRAMRDWTGVSLHLFTASRDESDIREEMEPLPEETIKAQNSEHDQDIRNFISHQLENNRKLRKWKPYHEQIETSLVRRSRGGFQWVACQLDVLQTCPRSEHLLQLHLDALPKTLEKTYEAILCNIPPTFKDYAQRVLTILCCANRPLTCSELIDAIAVNLDAEACYDRRRKLLDIDSVQQVCPGLTEQYEHEFDGENTIRLAHFSVREYLESDEILSMERTAVFSIRRPEGNTDMARICLAMLSDPSLPPLGPTPSSTAPHDLRLYCGENLQSHYRFSTKSSILHKELIKLFEDTSGCFQTFTIILNESYPTMSPLYQAVCLGASPVVDHLLETGSPTDREAYQAQAIPIASIRGSEAVVRSLLDHDGLRFESECVRAVSNATSSGCVRIVQLLLDRGVDLKAAEADSLTEAVVNGHENVLKLLLERGADVNAQRESRRSGPERAIDRVFEWPKPPISLLRILLSYRADVHWRNDGPLRAAASMGSLEAVKTLVDHGADVHAESGDALGQASSGGHLDVVGFLLDHGADVNARTGALIKAASKGHKEVVKTLLQRGADIAAYGNGALEDAAQGGHTEVVQLLIDYGLDVNACGPQQPPMLQLAAASGRATTVQVLIDYKAEVNMKVSVYFGTALQAAAIQGFPDVVRILLGHGADVNSEAGKYGSALEGAMARGHKEVVRLLQQHGARSTPHCELNKKPLTQWRDNYTAIGMRRA